MGKVFHGQEIHFGSFGFKNWGSLLCFLIALNRLLWAVTLQDRGRLWLVYTFPKPLGHDGLLQEGLSQRVTTEQFVGY